MSWPCFDLNPRDCDLLDRPRGIMEQWVEQTVVKGLGGHLLPHVVGLATVGILACCLGMMIFGRPGVWLRRAALIFGIVLVWMAWSTP